MLVILGEECSRQPGAYMITNNTVSRRSQPPLAANHFFRGECNAEGERHGPGLERLASGTVYRGEYQNNQRHGQGQLFIGNSGISYTGQFGAIDGVIRCSAWKARKKRKELSLELSLRYQQSNSHRLRSLLLPNSYLPGSQWRLSRRRYTDHDNAAHHHDRPVGKRQTAWPR